MKWPTIQIDGMYVFAIVTTVIISLFAVNLGFCGFWTAQVLSNLIGIALFPLGATQTSVVASFSIGMALLFIGIAFGRKAPTSGILSFLTGINGLALLIVCFFPHASASMHAASSSIPILLGFALTNGSRCMAYHMEKRNPPKKKPEREPGMGPLVTYAVLMMLVFVLLAANTQPMSQNGIAPALILGVTMIGAMLAGIVIHSRFLKIPLVLFGLAMLAVNPLLGPPGFIDVLWSRSLLLVLALLCYSFGCHARTLIRSAAAAACARGAPAYVQGTHISSGGGYSGGGGGGASSSDSASDPGSSGSQPAGASVLSMGSHGGGNREHYDSHGNYAGSSERGSWIDGHGSDTTVHRDTGGNVAGTSHQGSWIDGHGSDTTVHHDSSGNYAGTSHRGGGWISGENSNWTYHTDASGNHAGYTDEKGDRYDASGNYVGHDD